MKKSLHLMLSVIAGLALVLSACAPAAQPTAAPATSAPTAKLAVGIVLPTKDEPRWVQDETRFKEALTAAGYEAEILFSQGSSATEKANV
ncbi:MAG: sugar ABC transporter substrate-binding protein, partial [Anaerolineales bacterium]